MSPKELVGILTTPEAEKILAKVIGKDDVLSKSHVEILINVIKVSYKEGYLSALDRAQLYLRAEEEHDAADFVKKLRG